MVLARHPPARPQIADLCQQIQDVPLTSGHKSTEVVHFKMKIVITCQKELQHVDLAKTFVCMFTFPCPPVTCHVRVMAS